MISFNDDQSGNNAPNRIRAYFVVSGKEFDPESVTSRSNLEPTKTWRIGDIRHEKTGRLHEDNGWRLDGDSEATDAIDSHVVALLNRLDQAGLNWNEVCPDGHRQISIVVYATAFVPALYLSSDVLRRIAGLGASLDIDFYDLRQDSDDDHT